MSNRNNITYEELTEEGKRMWDNITTFEKLASGVRRGKKPPELKLNMFEVEVIFLRTELRKMIYNSQKVVRDCENIIMFLKDEKEYLASDAKVAKLIHENLIIRLKRVLDSMPAFEHEIVVDDEPPRPYAEVITSSVKGKPKDRKLTLLDETKDD